MARRKGTPVLGARPRRRRRPLPPPPAAPANALAFRPPTPAAVVAVAADAKPTILVAEKLGKGGVDMLKEV